jgi:hypothetical protein
MAREIGWTENFPNHLRAGLPHDNSPTLNLSVIQGVDRFTGLGLRTHNYKPEPARLTGESAFNYPG